MALMSLKLQPKDLSIMDRGAIRWSDETRLLMHQVIASC